MYSKSAPQAGHRAADRPVIVNALVDHQDKDAALTGLGQQRAESGAMHFYEGLVNGTINVPDVYLVSPCKRAQQTLEPYLEAHERFTGEKPKVIAAWALREQGGCVASGVERESWDIPTIMGSTPANDSDKAWDTEGHENDLETRASDIKDLFSEIGSQIYTRTGKGKMKFPFWQDMTEANEQLRISWPSLTPISANVSGKPTRGTTSRCTMGKGHLSPLAYPLLTGRRPGIKVPTTAALDPKASLETNTRNSANGCRNSLQGIL